MLHRYILSHRSSFLYQSLYHQNKCFFARRMATPMSYSERKIFQQESKHTETIDLHKEKEREDPTSKEIDDLWMSQAHLGVQNLPDRFLKRCQQVFSKFEATEIRQWGKSYMKLYQLLHATEKPQDLTKIKQPFCNTDDIVKDNQAILYLGKKRYDTTEGEEKPKKEKKIPLKLEDKLKEGQEEEDNDKINLKNKDNSNPDYGIVYEKNAVLAYMLRKMPHTFGVACRVFTELKYRLPDLKPQTFLDFGAGLGNCYKII